MSGVAFARSMPALGFDPAPGDPSSVSRLGSRYNEIAAELEQIGAAVGAMTLSGWQGQAATTTLAHLKAMAGPLSQAAATAGQLSDVTAAWAARLTSYQSEADALESRAAAQIADGASLATMRSTVSGTLSARLGADIAESNAALAAIRAQAEQLHAEYLATAATLMGVVNLASWWDSTEDFRKYPEGALAITDIATLDHWIAWAKRIGLVPEKALDPLDESLAEITALVERAVPFEKVATALAKGGRTAETAGNLLAADGAFAPAWVKAFERSVPGLEWGGRVLGGAGILADTADILSPQDSGAVGWVDRSAAAVNGGFLAADLLGADAVMSFIPGVGEVAIAATGIYLAGDFFYHHFTPFHDLVNDVGHSVVATAEDDGDAIVGASKDVSHDASAVWHSILSL